MKYNPEAHESRPSVGGGAFTDREAPQPTAHEVVSFAPRKPDATAPTQQVAVMRKQGADQGVRVDAASASRERSQRLGRVTKDDEQLWKRRDEVAEALRTTNKTVKEIADEKGVVQGTIYKDIRALEEEAVRKVLAGIEIPDGPVDEKSPLGREIDERLWAGMQPYNDKTSELSRREKQAEDYRESRALKAERNRLWRDPELTGLRSAWGRLVEGKPIFESNKTRPE